MFQQHPPRQLALVALISLALNQPAQAQHSPDYLGVSLRAVPTTSAGYAAARTGWDGIGAAIRLGTAWQSRLAGEVEVAGVRHTGQPGVSNCPVTARSGCGIGAVTASARLARAVPLFDGVDLLLGGGPSILHLSGHLNGSYLGAQGVASLGVPLGGRWRLRGDWLGSWYPDGRGGAQNSQWEFQFGINWHRSQRCTIDPDGLIASPTEVEIQVGEIKALDVQAPTCNGAEPVLLESSSPAIAQVTPSTPNVMGLSTGSALVTVRGYKTGRSAQVSVTVVRGASPQPHHVPGAPEAPEATDAHAPRTTPDGDPVVAVVALEPIYFSFDRATLTAEGVTEARRWAESLRGIKAPGKALVIGHTDHKGPAAYNRRLGQARAEAVTQVLVEAGVSGDRLYAISAGELEPLGDPQSPADQAKSRRVEVRRIPG